VIGMSGPLLHDDFYSTRDVEFVLDEQFQNIIFNKESFRFLKVFVAERREIIEGEIKSSHGFHSALTSQVENSVF